MLHLAYDATVDASSYASTVPAPAAIQIRLPQKQKLSLTGDQEGSLYRLVDGCVALTQYLPDGRRQVCDIIGPERTFALVIRGQRPCFVEALTHSIVERRDLQPSMERGLPGELANLLLRQQSHALLLGRKTAAERVASAIIDLSQQFARKRQRGTRTRVVFPVFPTRADLADWLGLTLETVSRCLSAFKQQRLIRFSRPELISIVDIDGLRRAAGMLTADQAIFEHAS